MEKIGELSAAPDDLDSLNHVFWRGLSLATLPSLGLWLAIFALVRIAAQQVTP